MWHHFHSSNLGDVSLGWMVKFHCDNNTQISSKPNITLCHLTQTKWCSQCFDRKSLCHSSKSPTMFFWSWNSIIISSNHVSLHVIAPFYSLLNTHPFNQTILRLGTVSHSQASKCFIFKMSVTSFQMNCISSFDFFSLQNERFIHLFYECKFQNWRQSSLLQNHASFKKWYQVKLFHEQVLDEDTSHHIQASFLFVLHLLCCAITRFLWIHTHYS